MFRMDPVLFVLSLVIAAFLFVLASGTFLTEEERIEMRKQQCLAVGDCYPGWNCVREIPSDKLGKCSDE